MPTKLLFYPEIDPRRWEQLQVAGQGAQMINAASEAEATRHIVDADGFVGKITPDLLRRAEKLRWVQCPTASLEHYIFPELTAHPAVLTNARGIHADVVAEHAWALILGFAKNLPQYIRQQAVGDWQPAGGKMAPPDFVNGPAVATSADHAHLHLADQTLGIVGLGYIGREVAGVARRLECEC